MKLRNKLIVATTAAVLSASASATLNFDLRHEYKDSNATSDGHAEHASRFKFGDTFKINKEWKANLSLETKFKSDEPEDFMTDIYINEMEVDMGLTYNLGGGWLLKPGMPINVAFDEPNDNGGQHLYRKKITYKPQVRIQYTAKLGSVKWKTALRYRHEFADYRSNQSGDSTVDGNKVTNPQTSKVTYSGGLSFKEVKKLYLAWEANYTKSHDDVKKSTPGGDAEDYDWDAGITLGYKIGNFRPYVEYWNIKNSKPTGNPKNSGDRGNKYRIGLKYYWK